MEFICKETNQEFSSRKSLIYHIKNKLKISVEEYCIKYLDILPQAKCLHCNNMSTWNNSKWGYNITCPDKKCIGKQANTISKIKFKEKYGVDNPSQLKSVKEQVKKTKLEKYGSETYNNTEKAKLTNIEKYGVDNAAKSDLVKEKIRNSLSKVNIKEKISKTKATNLEKYGVEFISQSKEIQRIIQKNNIEKYGSKHPMQNEKFIKEVFQKSLKEKYGVINISQIPKVANKIKQSKFINRQQRLTSKLGNLIQSFPTKNSVEIKCPECNKNSTLNIGFLEQRHKFDMDLCLHCTPYKIQSYIQQELANWIKKELNIEIIENYKIPNSNKEIDIYIPHKNIGIEVNGLYWHGEKFRHEKWHQEKKLLGIENNINIINIWEDELKLNRLLIENRLRSILLHNNKIFARKCTIKEVSVADSKAFFDEYHLHGFIGGKIKLGLYYNDNLYSMIILGNRNEFKDESYELLRYATKSNISITGGFNKLISYGIKNYGIDKITTYIDLDWCNYRDNIYEHSKFNFIKMTIPKFHWVVNSKRENRIKYQKWKLVQAGADKNKTANEIMHDAGYYKIWDTGNLKYEWNK